MRAFFHAVITAIGRRFGWVIAGLLLLALGLPGRAEAQLRGNTATAILCTNQVTTTCTTKDMAIQIAQDGATALSVCVEQGHTAAGGFGAWIAHYVNHTTFNAGSAAEFINANYSDTVPGGGGEVACGSKQFYWKPKVCTAGSVLPSITWATTSGPVCHDGCIYDPSGDVSNITLTKTIDGITYVNVSGYATTNDTMACSIPHTTTPPPDSDGDGKSDANDPSPNNPGDSGGNGPDAPSGDGNGDGDGSGNGDRSSGGGTCAAPPSSSGNQINAMVAYQTWATRCAIENAKNGDGSLKTAPAGSTPGGGDGSGDGTDMGPTNGILKGIKGVMDGVKGGIDSLRGGVDGIKDQLSGSGTDAGFDGQVAAINTDEEPPTDGEEDDPTEDLKIIEDNGTILDRLDNSGFLGGGACPADKPVSLGGGATMNLSFAPLCQLLAAVSGLVMAAAYLIAFKIMAA